MNKKYGFKVGVVFFAVIFILSIYYSFTVLGNAIHISRVDQTTTLNFGMMLNYIPGFTFLKGFLYTGTIGGIAGSVIISFVYGLIGVLIGSFFDKNRKS